MEQKNHTHHLLICIELQKLYLFEDDEVKKEYDISTSKNQPSNKEGSYGTPLGEFYIAEKIGGRELEGMIFRGRKATGELYYNFEGGREDDLITSRILWLEGKEVGVNDNTKSRYIYIHGTNREDLIGRAESKGCIRMRNRDIIELFDVVGEGDLVFIE